MANEKRFDECTERSKGRQVVAEERGRKFIVHNPSRRMIHKVKIDGCVIQDNTPRCDYVVEVLQPNKWVYFVELKGKDVEKAFNQLTTTMTRFHSRYASYCKAAYIVASRVPKSGPGTQKLAFDMRKSHGVKLTIKNMICEVDCP